MGRSQRPKVLLVNPRFNLRSFWNYRETCTVVGARCVSAPLGLITLAALLPTDWSIRLVDRNIEELLDGDLDWGDMVMVGSMLSQQRDARRIMGVPTPAQSPS